MFLYFIESKHASPLLNFSVFTAKDFLAANLLGFCIYAGLTSYLLIWGLYFEKLYNYLENNHKNLKEFKVNGLLILYNNMLQSLFSSQIKSLGFVILSIFLMFIILLCLAFIWLEYTIFMSETNYLCF